jgi:uncharacterized protein DUF4115
MNPRGPRKKGDRPGIPPRVLQPGTAGPRRFGRRRSHRPLLVPVVGAVAVIVVALVIVGALAGSDNGGSGDKPSHQSSKGKAAGPTTTNETSAASSTPTTTTASGRVSVELRSISDVWVCLVDDRGRTLVNSETLTANQTRGPFDARGFEVTFGNGSVQMTVNGQQAKVPQVAEPIGFRITPTATKRLSAGAGPSCT